MEKDTAAPDTNHEDASAEGGGCTPGPRGRKARCPFFSDGTKTPFLKQTPWQKPVLPRHEAEACPHPFLQLLRVIREPAINAALLGVMSANPQGNPGCRLSPSIFIRAVSQVGTLSDCPEAAQDCATSKLTQQLLASVYKTWTEPYLLSSPQAARPPSFPRPVSPLLLAR